jgi:hypothetical protein
MAPVTLHLYDLSQGMARQMSMAMIGKQLDGIWHSGIVVFGVEYFYGGGICAAPAGRAIPHMSYQTIPLGETSKSQIELEGFLQTINHRFTQATYSLLRHNCNNFANEVAVFLTGKGIPDHIIRLPQEFLTSPMGAALAPMIEGMEQRMRNELIGEGRGLNPFGHIQGRVPLFPSNPAVSDTPSVTLPIADSKPVDSLWLEGDTNLLKTAVDGIPSPIMSDGLKSKVCSIDPSVVEELVGVMNSSFAEKPAILLTFATIVRFFWKLPTFRDSLTSESGWELLEKLLKSSMSSTSSHVSTALLAVVVNISASECGAKRLFQSGIFVDIVTSELDSTPRKKMVPMILLNLVQHIKPLDESSLYAALFRVCLAVAMQHSKLDSSFPVTHYLRTIDEASRGLLECKVALKEVHFSPEECEKLISLAENVDETYGLQMPYLIRIIVEREDQ